MNDENHKPVAGALVVLMLAKYDPFKASSLRATTDATGRVRANFLQLKGDPGSFDVRVKASCQVGRRRGPSIRRTQRRRSRMRQVPRIRLTPPGSMQFQPAASPSAWFCSWQRWLRARSSAVAFDPEAGKPERFPSEPRISNLRGGASSCCRLCGRVPYSC